ncbi:MAG: DUF4956 domain-containing protein [Peptococcaceae bacterium]|nr:DUF4956 domain-containing protein [Peptococcaceae bacterium]
MTFNDIFKSGFLENISSISILDMLLTIVLSFCIGIFIFLVYKKTYRGVMYSSGFGTTLIALTMITAIIILAVSSNVVLSLGMVGALSIVRFRAAIKDPLDICFLFWSIGAGIILAAGMIPLAVLGSVCIGLVLLIFVNHTSPTRPYMVVLNCADHDVEEKAMNFIAQNVVRNVLKSKSAVKGAIELNIEVRLRNDNTDFINELAEIPGISSAIIVSYNGDYMG